MGEIKQKFGENEKSKRKQPRVACKFQKDENESRESFQYLEIFIFLGKIMNTLSRMSLVLHLLSSDYFHLLRIKREGTPSFHWLVSKQAYNIINKCSEYTYLQLAINSMLSHELKFVLSSLIAWSMHFGQQLVTLLQPLLPPHSTLSLTWIFSYADHRFYTEQQAGLLMSQQSEISGMQSVL